jgi:general secretion pathway protein G
MQHLQRSRSAFTLIEVLLVVAILGILTSIVAVKTIGQTDNTKKQAAWTQISVFKTAIAQFDMEVGRLPKDLAELVYEGDSNWPGPFLDSEELPNDPWGQPYRYELRGKRIRITSGGPDGQLGTTDDLWK